MPSRSKFIRSYQELVARLGGGVERHAWEQSADGARTRRHAGWRWPCDCSAFARAEDEHYMWVPCLAHAVGTAEA